MSLVDEAWTRTLSEMGWVDQTKLAAELEDQSLVQESLCVHTAFCGDIFAYRVTDGPEGLPLTTLKDSEMLLKVYHAHHLSADENEQWIEVAQSDWGYLVLCCHGPDVQDPDLHKAYQQLVLSSSRPDPSTPPAATPADPSQTPA